MKTKAAGTSILEKAMLVNLSISYWTGKASDEQVVDELTKSHGSDRDVHDYRKRLVKAEAIQKFKAVRSRARAYHLEKTLPWIDGGTRILPAKLYMDYTKAMHTFHNEYQTEVSEFKRRYPTYKAEAKKRLGSLYVETDYPTAERLQQKFGWDMHVFPIPSGKDFRVALGDGEQKILQLQVEKQVGEALAIATRDLWRRLHEVIKALAAKMKDADPTFRDSIIGNIRDLLGILPAMNVTDDPKLKTMAAEIGTTLAKLDPQALRDDDKLRKKTADAADDLLKTMAAYIGGDK